MVVLKKYPKVSGYLDRISKIWIMKKFDIQSIQVSMYPKKTDTLESGIDVGPTFINFGFFSRPYGLIREYIKVI